MVPMRYYYKNCNDLCFDHAFAMAIVETRLLATAVTKQPFCLFYVNQMLYVQIRVIIHCYFDSAFTTFIFIRVLLLQHNMVSNVKKNIYIKIPM